jgi:hypothetical protein
MGEQGGGAPSFLSLPLVGRAGRGWRQGDDQDMNVVERPTQTETLQMFAELSLPPPQGEGREGVRDKEMTRT